MKEFSKFEIATIKRTAQNVAPLVRKKNKIKSKMVELQAELDYLESQQTQWENAITTMTGGYTTEDLVERVVEATGSVDKDGNPIKITKYVLKYPNTVIPVEETRVCTEVDSDSFCAGEIPSGFSSEEETMEAPVSRPIVTETVNWNY